MDEEIPVPAPDAEWHEIWRFAHTYNGYERHGKNVGDMANALSKRWQASGGLPESLDTLRAALFFEARRFRHYGTDPADDGAEYVRQLVSRIRELSGGSVPGPADELP